MPPGVGGIDCGTVVGLTPCLGGGKMKLIVTWPKVETLLTTRLDGVPKGWPCNALGVCKCEPRDVGREVVFSSYSFRVTWFNDASHKREVLVVVICVREAISRSSGGINILSIELDLDASIKEDYLLYISC